VATRVKESRADSLTVTFQRLRKMIVSGQLSPGSRIIETELAERLGFSRTPVRGALQLLQREGLVIGAGKGGKQRMLVAPLTKEDSRELYSIVGVVEGLAARLTAQLPAAARERLVRRLRSLNSGLEELARAHRRDPNRTFELDRTFHRSIVEASAGPRLLDLHNSIQPQTERYWRLYASSIVDQLADSVAEHKAIILAIAGGDAEGAERGLQANWENGAARLARVIDSLGERGSWL
jgi:DNA-binding GntR family transcriptional regulator